MSRRVVLATAGAALLTVLALASCSVAVTPQSDLQPAYPNHLRSIPSEESYGTGPVILLVDLSSTQITTAQNLELTIMARSSLGWSVSLPKVGAQIGGFTVVAHSGDRPRLTSGNRILHQRRYFLRPFLAGRYLIPPLVVTASNGTMTKTVESSALAVTVKSLIPESAKRPLELERPAGPVAVPSPFPEVFGGATILLAALTASFLFFAGRLRRRRLRRRGAVRPWQRALRELDRLVELDLVRRGRQREFHRRLGLILRRYIEQVFEVNAPEQSTEEFLYAVRDSSLLGQHRRLLRDFLMHCDLAKFAPYLPAHEGVDRATDSLRNLIDATRDDSRRGGWEDR